MPRRKRYRKRPERAVTAVQLNVKTPGFAYHKWGDYQRCHSGDWIVDNDGDVYTIDSDAFSRTYRRVAPGRYIKTAPVWAYIAKEQGAIKTLEGMTHYQAGDYIVSNDVEGKDCYAMNTEEFHNMYELDEWQ